jgi:hypothetical protein
MKIHLVSFASRKFYKNQRLLVKSARKNGITSFFTWKYYHLFVRLFFYKNLKTLRSPRGAGYWAWQPYVILESMARIDDGDILFFCDSGFEFVNNLNSMPEILKTNDIVLFAAGNYINKHYTKRDAFILMNSDQENYWNAPQITGGIHMWKKTPYSEKVLKEYLFYSTQYQIVSDSPSQLGENLEGFIDHRHPQSILSILAVKFDIPIWNPPTMDMESFSSEVDLFDLNRISEVKGSTRFLKTNRLIKLALLDRILGKFGLWI